jgi:hypothetical protein
MASLRSQRKPKSAVSKHVACEAANQQAVIPDERSEDPESRPVRPIELWYWIPAFAGMTGRDCGKEVLSPSC